MPSYTKTRKPNIYKTASGTYRARKRMNGERMTSNFRTLKEAINWLNSL